MENNNVTDCSGQKNESCLGYMKNKSSMVNAVVDALNKGLCPIICSQQKTSEKNRLADRSVMRQDIS